MSATVEQLLFGYGIVVESARNLHRAAVEVEAPAKLSRAEFHSSCAVGAYTYFGPGHVYSLERIGRFCSVGPGVLIGGGNHPTDWLSTHPFQFGTEFDHWAECREFSGRLQRSSELIARAPRIGNDVWIGAGAIIARGVNIGDGAIIGAGALVTQDVEPYEVVAGVPARRLRFRFERATVERLLELRWWNYELLSLAGVPFQTIGEALDELYSRLERGELKTARYTNLLIRDGALEQLGKGRP